MANLVPVFFMLFLISCSSSRIERKINDSSWDSFADESFMRWSDKRLEASHSSRKVVGCYSGEIDSTLNSLKTDFAKKDSLYWLQVANCYYLKDEWSKADFFYRLGLEEASSPLLKAHFLNNLALVQLKYNEWEKGRDYLKESIKLAPKSKIPRFNLSQLYLQFGHFQVAIKILKEFEGTKDVDIYFSLANAFVFMGDLLSAEKYFNLIPKESMKREDIADSYAIYMLKSGKNKEAEEIMNERERSGAPELTKISQKIEKIISLRLKQE